MQFKNSDFETVFETCRNIPSQSISGQQNVTIRKNGQIITFH